MTLFHNTTVTQETWHPKTMYNKTLSVPGEFRYIKIEIPDCYNDYSYAEVYNETESENQTENETQEGCTDFDRGRNYTVKGDVQGVCYECQNRTRKSASDYCVGKRRVHEFYCVNSTGWRSKEVNCSEEKVCRNGRCVEYQEEDENETDEENATVGFDMCEYNGGRSLPNSSAQDCGWPPGDEGYKQGCCCCYLKSHIHDLGKLFNSKEIEIRYRPGYRKGCTSPMYVYYSTGGENFTKFYGTNVTQEAWSPKTTYEKNLSVPDQFRYIKIEIPDCYNDYSSARVQGYQNVTDKEDEEDDGSEEGDDEDSGDDAGGDEGGGGGSGGGHAVVIGDSSTTTHDSVNKSEGEEDNGEDTGGEESEDQDQDKEGEVNESQGGSCQGCMHEGKCISYGARLQVGEEASYCAQNNRFRKQKEEGENCTNNYECKSNFCSEGECYDIKEGVESTQKELEETKGLVQRIVGVLSKFFNFNR